MTISESNGTQICHQVFFFNKYIFACVLFDGSIEHKMAVYNVNLSESAEYNLCGPKVVTARNGG